MNGFYSRDVTLCSPVVTICTASLTFNNSTFCPHIVFMCFLWISEQTAIISLYNRNGRVFITETECVYCAVRLGFPLPFSKFSVATQNPHSISFFPVRQRKINFKIFRQNATKVSSICCTPNPKLTPKP